MVPCFASGHKCNFIICARLLNSVGNIVIQIIVFILFFHEEHEGSGQEFIANLPLKIYFII